MVEAAWDQMVTVGRVARLQGFGLEDTHSIASSLRWGPGGWLYGAQGSTVSAAILRPGRVERMRGAEVHISILRAGREIWRSVGSSEAPAKTAELRARIKQTVDLALRRFPPKSED